jgi:hypothetical protein
VEDCWDELSGPSTFTEQFLQLQRKVERYSGRQGSETVALGLRIYLLYIDKGLRGCGVGWPVSKNGPP